jgi:hypothetical protein
MKTKVYLAIAIRLILLFGVGMLSTFLPQYFRDFFGDTLHVHTVECAKCYSGCVNSNDYDALYDWGVRHYWYFNLMLCLFVLSLINFVFSVINVIKKNYDTSNW